MGKVLLMRSSLLTLAMVLALPSMVGAQSSTRVLFVPGGSLPRHMHGPVRGLLASRAVLVSTDAYRRAAHRANVRASSPRGVRRIGTRQGADVIVIATWGGHFRRRVLRARFFGGRSGELITSGTYRMRGRGLRPASQHALLRDLERAAEASRSPGAAVAEPAAAPPVAAPPAPPPVEPPHAEAPPAARARDEELPPPLSWDEPPPPSRQEPPAEERGAETTTPEQEATQEGEPARLWGFALGAGIGVGMRASTVPLQGAEAKLSSTAYPTIQVGALGHLRPDATSRFRVEVSARYTASVGLQVEDRAAEGGAQSTDMRTHHVIIALTARLPLAPGERMTELLLGASGSFGILETDLDVSIPNFAVGGVYARLGFNFYVGDSPLSIAVVPELGYAASLSDELSELAQVSDGFSVGAEGVVRLQIVDEVSVSLLYRESHAFLGSARGSEMHDVTRYGVLGVRYEH